MMIKLLLYVLLIGFFFLQCSERKEQRQVFLKPERQVKFPVDNFTSYETMFIQAINEGGVEQLLYLGMNKPSILFFSIETEKLINEILLQTEGPHSVGKPSGLLYKSPDSIFVFSTTHYQVTLINSKGEALKRYYTLGATEKPNDETGTIRPYTIAPPVLIGHTLFMNIGPDRKVYHPDYFNGATRMRLNINSGEFEYFDSYTREYKGNIWGVNATSLSTIYNGKNFVYSFPISDSVYTADTSGILKGFYATTQLSDKKITPMPTPDHDLQYVLGQIQYAGIIYDKYRKVYYRFVKHPLPYKNDKGEINNFHSKPLSVIILNDSLQVIGETQLEDYRFISHMYFVAKEGFFISNSNPKNYRLDENFSEFTLFSLTEK